MDEQKRRRKILYLLNIKNIYGCYILPTKAELLNKLKKPQLLEIAKKKKITVPSRRKDKIVTVLASRLTKTEIERFIARYLKVEAEKEIEEEVTVRRRVRKRVKIKATEIERSVKRIKKSDKLILDVIEAIQKYGYPLRELIEDYKRKVGRPPSTMDPITIVRRAPPELSLIHI